MATVFEPPQPPQFSQAPPPAPAGDDDGPHWPWWAPFVVGIGIYVGLGLSVAIVAAAAGWDAGGLPDRFILGATIVQDVLLVVLAVAVAAAAGPRALHHLGIRTTSFWGGIGWSLATFGIFFAFLLAWQALLSIEESDDLAVELGAKDSTLNLVTVAILVCLFAPVAEELFFRGFMFGALRKAIGWIAGAVATGLVFGLIHAGGTEPEFLVPLAVLGGLLCWLYQKTSSLLPGMGIHAFNNALALGVTLEWAPEAVLGTVVAAPVLVVSLAAAVARR